MRRPPDDVLDVEEPRPSPPRARPRLKASDRLRLKAGPTPRRGLVLYLAAGGLVLALLVATGFMLGGEAKANRFALGPLKLGKLKVKTFDEPEFAIRFRYPEAFNQVQVRIGSSAGARPAAQRAIGLKGEVTSVGGLPALEYEAFDLRRPAKAQSRLLVLFDGVTEYLVNCQSMPDQRKQVEAACDLVKGSLETV